LSKLSEQLLNIDDSREEALRKASWVVNVPNLLPDEAETSLGKYYVENVFEQYVVRVRSHSAQDFS
jgi:hypothetical protein